MNKPRQAVADALLKLLKTSTYQWTTVDNTTQVWDNFPIADQPAALLLKVGEDIMQERVFGAAKYTLHYKILCYFRGDAESHTAPETFYNPALDALDALFKSVPPGLPQTLGGLVAHAWIEGATLVAGGILDSQIVLAVPVKVLTGD